MPDLMYPRFQKWYNTSTYISSMTDSYNGHMCRAGRNFTSTIIAERLWHTNTPPARSANVHANNTAIDLTTPAYMLADTAGGTAVTEDTVIGLDYCNLPIRLHKDLAALEVHSDGNQANNVNYFMRTLAIQHKFTFVNYSRFPLEVYWAILPAGHLFPVPTGSFEPHVDIMAQTFKKVVVPAVRDANDRSQKSTIEVAVNLKKLWPHEYDIAPGQNMSSTTQAASANHANSPWLSLAPAATTVAVIRNFPPGQTNTDAHSTPDFVSDGPTCGLRMQWFAKLQNPRDLGSTTEGNSTEGDFVGNNYDVHASMSWLMDIMRVGQFPQIHTGEKAYPSTTA